MKFLSLVLPFLANLKLVFAGVLDDIGTVIQEVFDWIVDTFNKVSTIFWDPTLNSNAGGFTFVGYLLIIAFGITMIWVVLQFIKKLVRRG